MVVTGEGELNRQSCFGKAPLEIAKIAKNHGVSAIAICGKVSDRKCTSEYFEEVFELISANISQEKAIKNAEYYLREISKKVAELVEEMNHEAHGK